jgi:hypothetical protein
MYGHYRHRQTARKQKSWPPGENTDRAAKRATADVTASLMPVAQAPDLKGFPQTNPPAVAEKTQGIHRPKKVFW